MGLSLSHLLEQPFGSKLVTILQWGAEIEIFNPKLVEYPNLNIGCLSSKFKHSICAGDIELTPGFRKSNTSWNWNLNSIPACSFSELS